jgi:hypothetical protein
MQIHLRDGIAQSVATHYRLEICGSIASNEKTFSSISQHPDRL